MNFLKTIITIAVTTFNLVFMDAKKEINNILKEEKVEIEETVKVESLDNTDNYGNPVLSSFYGNVTAYTPYCDGCSGITASSYNVLNTMYYEDPTYGNLRIIAADKSIPYGSIIKISGLNNYEEIMTIVLDRGGAIGNNKRAQADLLFSNYNEAINFGIQYNVLFEILRFGY